MFRIKLGTRISAFVTVVTLSFIGSSCMNPKKVVYFDNIQDTILKPPPADLEPVIRSSDILSITVTSLNPKASELFNIPNVSAASSASNSSTTTTAVNGYLVDLDGNIQFPIIGNIKAAGLTKKKLKDQLTKMMIDKKLLVDPIVDIRYLNFRVSVIGEVARPGVVTATSERITLLEALALAGDLTIYARRDNVMLIRDNENGQRIIKRIDLNSSSILTSEYFYLKSNDVIYAEPSKSKVTTSTSRANIWVPIVFSVLSFAIVVVDRVN